MPSATNSSLMRLKNEKTILSLINKAPISRADIAKRTGLTKAAVTIITEDLLSRGIIREEKSEEAIRVGRTPILLKLCGDALYFVGVNIKRTGIYVGICNLCGEVLSEEKFGIDLPDESLVRIVEVIRSMTKNLGLSEDKIYKISVVTPGPVDSERGVILNPPNFRSWHGVNVTERLSGSLGIPVMLSNVSTATAVSERYFGSAEKDGGFVALLVDEGIGSGIMLGDKLFKGSCEIGHITVKFDGEKCECGNSGCLEKYASVPNILKGSPYKSWSECVNAKDGEIMSREAEYLSSAIVTVNNIFDLERAVLCGDISENSQFFTSLVESKTREKMILKKDFRVIGGTVKSAILVPCAMGVYDFLS